MKNLMSMPLIAGLVMLAAAAPAHAASSPESGSHDMGFTGISDIAPPSVVPIGGTGCAGAGAADCSGKAGPVAGIPTPEPIPPGTPGPTAGDLPPSVLGGQVPPGGGNNPPAIGGGTTTLAALSPAAGGLGSLSPSAGGGLGGKDADAEYYSCVNAYLQASTVDSFDCKSE